jgi:hypothetical protein
MFVTNGNWDRQDDSSTLTVLDVGRLDEGLADPAPVASDPTLDRPCRLASVGGRVECDASLLIDAGRTVRLPSGAGNIAVDAQFGPADAVRLLVPSRLDPTLSWIDATDLGGGNPQLACGQAADRRCDDDHTIEIADDPSRIAVDVQGFRYAYLPHLLEASDCGDGCAGVSLIGLDGEFGPELVDSAQDFFEEDPLHESGLRGGFAVGQRPCDPDDPPIETRECTRPLLYATQRYWPGVRLFRVAPGLDLLLASRTAAILGVAVEGSIDRPRMGDLDFEDPKVGDRLLVVHTTPPGLARVDTSLDADGLPRDELMQSLPLCNNPNLLELFRPVGEEWLAFVSCYGADEVAVVSLATFTVIRTIEVGAGGNEMVVDPDRERLYVANIREHSISVVDLDRGSPSFLTEVGVIGLGSRR